MAIYRGTGGANEATDLATNQAVVAKEYAEQAAVSATEANLTLDAFQDIYLGAFASAPTVDGDGNPLQVGALYFNTSDLLLRIWSGSSWLVSAVSEPSSFARNTFSGNGSQTVFTLSSAPVNNDSVFVFISGVLTTAYNVVGTTLTFTTAPASGTNNVLAIVASTVSTLAPADNSVSTAKLQEGAVTTSKIGDLQVATVKIADLAVLTSKIADDQITTAKILNANVTLDKLAANSVNASKIVDGSVGSAELASNAVTTVKITDANVTTDKIADGAVTLAKLSASTLANLLPAGIIIDFAGTIAPSGYLACPIVPTNVSRTTYAALFAAIGTTWGAGDGSTTFGLPYFPENYTSLQANANVGTLSSGEVKSHSHTFSTTNPSSSGGNTGQGTGTGGVATISTSSTGGTANLAAGVRVLKCVKI